jgi:hypothetical protein
MASIRRRLRVCVTIWLLFQAASLAALVPAACCRQEPVKEVPQASQPEHSCHEAVPTPPAPEPMCVLRSGCDPHGAAILGLLANQGPIPTAVSLLPRIDAARHSMVPREHPASLFPTPDSPPPRA